MTRNLKRERVHKQSRRVKPNQTRRAERKGFAILITSKGRCIQQSGCFWCKKEPTLNSRPSVHTYCIKLNKNNSPINCFGHPCISKTSEFDGSKITNKVTNRHQKSPIVTNRHQKSPIKSQTFHRLTPFLVYVKRWITSLNTCHL